MLIKGKIAARHGADQISFGNIFDMTAFDFRTIAQNGIIIANLEDFFHLVADEDNRVIAIEKTTNNPEDTLDFNTRQRRCRLIKDQQLRMERGRQDERHQVVSPLRPPCNSSRATRLSWMTRA